jgi:DNA mismatch repair protein MutS
MHGPRPLSQPTGEQPPATPATARGAPARAEAVTPMMAQYLAIKAANPDSLLFYRMGDFYELFFGDAEVASRALGIVLTRRGKHLGEDIAMCGVPVERADDYLQRLIAQGHRVAVCEQVEDPAQARKRGAKSVVQRAVVRLVTPGTITEERLLEPGRAHVFAAVAAVPGSDGTRDLAVAAIDISTGDFRLAASDPVALGADLARLEPREIVVPEELWADPALGATLRDAGAPVTPVGRIAGAPAAVQKLLDHFGVATLDGFGALTRAEIAAAALALHYVERTQMAARPNLVAPRRLSRGDTLEIDAATRANLELTRTLGGAREGSLLAAIDRTLTPPGARLLAERLAAPLTDPVVISHRHDAVEWLIAETATRESVRKLLRKVPDLLRAQSRLALVRGGPRDLAAIGEGLLTARDIAGLLRRDEAIPADLAALRPKLAAVDADVSAALRAALNQDLPLDRRDGNFIVAGFDPALDETRALRDESRRVIAALQQTYCDDTGMRQLRIKHNNMLGYFVEVPQAQGERLRQPPFDATFQHRQTMSGAMRFSTRQLGDLESRIASAAGSALAIELAHFDRLSGLVAEARENLTQTADALAELDVAASHADLAAERGWTRPLVDKTLSFVVEGGRHPVVEAALREQGVPFTANDCDLSGTGRGDAAGGRIAVVTGPNMAGKSTYLRQNALIVVLAQMGAFVPAARVHVGAVDRLFSRVGAADDLARGRSTFMVEMVETAAILNQATARSLVILDEIGRGTATFDGLSIAWATMEYLHDLNRARALFATHFHELTQLGRRLARLVNLTMRVTEYGGDLVFLHEVVPGAADRSYGIQVARLAGLPPAVLERAREILVDLEAQDRRVPVERLIADLPLFARPSSVSPTSTTDRVREKLAAIDPDALSPREALDALYALKQAAERGSG